MSSSEGGGRGESKKDLHERDPERYSDDSEESAGDDGDEVDRGGASSRPAGGGVSMDPREMLRRLIAGMTVSDDDVEKPEQVLDELTLDGVARYVKSGKVKNVITMAGAGISTSAGIPDFRSPGTGLYDNLQKYNLPNPQAIFSIEYFDENPEPFFKLAKELYPGKFTPTPSHLFVRLLEEKGLLLRHYTQNIDTLERAAGVTGDRLVEAHGTFHTAHCRGCEKEYTQEFVKDVIFADSIPTCESCNSVVKPDIVFFGESLPDKFHRLVPQDFKKCDLLIVMGTSLTVQPFASLVDRVPNTCPRLLLNMDKVGDDGSDYVLRLLGRGGMDFDSKHKYRDVARLGPCDEGCAELAEKLGWKDEFAALVQKHHGEKGDEVGGGAEKSPSSSSPASSAAAATATADGEKSKSEE